MRPGSPTIVMPPNWLMVEPVVVCNRLCEPTAEVMGKSLVGMRETDPCEPITAFSRTAGRTGTGFRLIGFPASAGGCCGTTSQRSSSDTRHATYFLPSSGTRLDMTTENQPSPPAV